MANINNMVSLNEIDENAMNLSRAQRVRIAEIIEKEGKNSARIIDNRWGIKNLKTGEIVDFCSDKYSILQHVDAVGMVTASLRSFGIEARGNLRNYGNAIAVEILFDNVAIRKNGEIMQSNMIVPDGAKGIQLGIRFVNSFNKSTGFRGYGFGWRLACSNGMYLTSILPEIAFGVKHTGDVVGRVADQMKRAILKLIDEKGAVITHVQKAQDDKIVFENQKQLVATLAGYVGSEKQATNIIETTGGRLDLNPSRWELYNAVTDYATHTQMSYPMQDRISRGAEKILIAPVSVVEMKDDSDIVVIDEDLEVE